MFTVVPDAAATVAAAAPTKAKAASSEVLTFSPTFRPAANKKRAPLAFKPGDDGSKENTPRNANAEVMTFSPTFRPPAKKPQQDKPPAVTTVLTLAVGGGVAAVVGVGAAWVAAQREPARVGAGRGGASGLRVRRGCVVVASRRPAVARASARRRWPATRHSPFPSTQRAPRHQKFAEQPYVDVGTVNVGHTFTMRFKLNLPTETPTAKITVDRVPTAKVRRTSERATPRPHRPHLHPLHHRDRDRRRHRHSCRPGLRRHARAGRDGLSRADAGRRDQR